MTTLRLLCKNNGNDLHTLLSPVESNNVSKKHPNCISWCSERKGLVHSQRGLKPLSRIVPEIANRTARKWHQAGPARKHASTEVFSNPFSSDHRKRLGHTLSFDVGLHACAAHDHFRFRAEKRIAGNALSAFN